MSLEPKDTLRNLLRDASTVRMIEPIPFKVRETQEEDVEETAD
jgi:hypothetical protein